MRFVQGVAIGLGASSLLAYAVTINSFTSGTPISSTDVNTNFTNLKNSVEALESKSSKFVVILPSNLVLTCASSPAFNTDYVNPTFNIEGGGTSNLYTVPHTGWYEIYADHAPFSNAMALARLEIVSGANENLPHLNGLRRRYTAGQQLKVWYACVNSKGKNPNSTIDSTKSYVMIRRL
ncbi:MAG TPA: hypothetical protein VNJ08_09815 [Bacteriovoracaceae bacterium]|nr:hypothetical protein [Bacteriovoracaceae bacterium]